MPAIIQRHDHLDSLSSVLGCWLVPAAVGVVVVAAVVVAVAVAATTQRPRVYGVRRTGATATGISREICLDSPDDTYWWVCEIVAGPGVACDVMTR